MSKFLEDSIIGDAVTFFLKKGITKGQVKILVNKCLQHGIQTGGLRSLWAVTEQYSSFDYRAIVG